MKSGDDVSVDLQQEYSKGRVGKSVRGDPTGRGGRGEAIGLPRPASRNATVLDGTPRRFPVVTALNHELRIENQPDCDRFRFQSSPTPHPHSSGTFGCAHWFFSRLGQTNSRSRLESNISGTAVFGGMVPESDESIV
jgi:hypothetical protein